MHELEVSQLTAAFLLGYTNRWFSLARSETLFELKAFASSNELFKLSDLVSSPQGAPIEWYQHRSHF